MDAEAWVLVDELSRDASEGESVHVERHVTDVSAVPVQGVEHRPDLASRARADLHDVTVSDIPDEGGRNRGEERRLRPGEIVFGQRGDALEEQRPVRS
jgi:hypothetical protein